jgi:hypothetical protein
MTIHACRDLVLGGSRQLATGSYDTMWALAVFLKGVVGYTTQSSAGSLLPNLNPSQTINYDSWNGSAFSTVSSSIIPESTPCCFISGSGGHTLLRFSQDMVNLMSAAFPTNWPQSSGSWPSQNPLLGSWAVIKSTQNPLANSGIFRITDVSSWLSQNSIEIDYRSTSPTLNETGSYVVASIWLPPPGSDTGTGSFGRGPVRTGVAWPTFNSLRATGDTTQYQGQGGSTYPRLLMKSPSSLNWNVRLALESTATISFGGSESTGNPAFTAIPGMGGSNGDFPVGQFGSPAALHLHGPQWFNFSYANAAAYVGSMPGIDALAVATTGSSTGGPQAGTAISYRFYAWADDVTGTCLVMLRNQSSASHVFAMFGQPEGETPVPGASSAQSLFVVGQTQRGFLAGVDWRCGAAKVEGVSGMAYSLDSRNGPLSCVMSSLSYVSASPANSSSIRFDVAAGDSPFLNATELTTSDLYAGTLDNNRNYSDNAVFPIEPRRMGRVPIARFGRVTGQPSWSTVDTNMQWFHALGGMYMPWGGINGL